MTTVDKALSLNKMGVEMRLTHKAKAWIVKENIDQKNKNEKAKIPQPPQQNDTETHLSLFVEKVCPENLKPCTCCTHEFSFKNCPTGMGQPIPSQEINVKTGPWRVILWECLEEAITKTRWRDILQSRI